MFDAKRVTHILCGVGDVLVHVDDLDRFAKSVMLEYKLDSHLAFGTITDVFINEAWRLFCRGYIGSEIYYEAVKSDFKDLLPKGTNFGFEQLKATLGKRILDNNPNMLSLLTNFKRQGKQVIICTDSNTWQSESYRERINLDDYADKVFESHHVGMLKDDPDYFPYLLHKLKIPGNHAILIDDKPLNNQMAGLSGIYAPGFNDSDQLKGELRKFGLL